VTIWRLPLTAWLCFSVATVMAEAAAVAAVWARGGLSQEKLVQLLAVAHGVDLQELWQRARVVPGLSNQEQLSADQVAQACAIASVDLDLREMAFENGLDELSGLVASLQEKRARYDQLKTAFDQDMDRIRQGALSPALRELQRNLESMPPKLAKDQLLRWLDDSDLVQPMQSVVTLLKAMPLAKRKKLVAEFKGEESDRLQEILRQIRQGVPEVTLIRETRNRLQQSEPLRPQTNQPPASTTADRSAEARTRSPRRL